MSETSFLLNHDDTRTRRTERTYEPISERAESVATAVMDAAFRVHRALGPGLLESVYEACVCHELARAQVRFQRQVSLPVIYDGMRVCGWICSWMIA
jgi:PD-(D/E)XK nuclease superfamily